MKNNSFLEFKKKYRIIRRKIFEAFKSEIYSRPSLYDIDRKLEKYLTQRNGFFIEVGANDGFNQSNTYYFERFRGWTGILVEGIPDLYQKCVLERPKSQVFNSALVSSDFPDSYVTMKYANLMSIVKGAFNNEETDNLHIKKGIEVAKSENINPYEVKVPARTLTSILDECNIKEIDFFSLDVEGFELNVLKGLDFNRYRPKYMLIETANKKTVEDYISELYVYIDQLSYHDYLYKLKSSN